MTSKDLSCLFGCQFRQLKYVRAKLDSDQAAHVSSAAHIPRGGCWRLDPLPGPVQLWKPFPGRHPSLSRGALIPSEIQGCPSLKDLKGQ